VASTITKLRGIHISMGITVERSQQFFRLTVTISSGEPLTIWKSFATKTDGIAPSFPIIVEESQVIFVVLLMLMLVCYKDRSLIVFLLRTAPSFLA